MALHVRHPVWLGAVGAPGAGAFAALFLLESIARAGLVTIIPLQAFALLKDNQIVSLAYTGVGLTALLATLLIPTLIRAIQRRWVYTLGCVAIMGSAALLAAETIPSQLVAMIARTFGAATLSITLSLYIMDFIRKQDLVRSEPLRFGVSTVAWTTCPFLGVWLSETFGLWAASLLSIAAAAATLALFWYLRMSDSKAIQAARTPPPNPIRNIRRFWSQPRLQLAWWIAFGRSCFWASFFVYAPQLMVASGKGAIAGALLISGANLMLFSNLWAGRLATRYGLSRTMTFAFAVSGAATILAGLFGVSHAYAAGGCLLVASFFVAWLDGLGPIPFLRAVHAYERPQMTTVYRTYVDASELLPPFIYAGLLGIFGLGVVFVTLGLWLAAVGWMTWRWLPKGM